MWDLHSLRDMNEKASRPHEVIVRTSIASAAKALLGELEIARRTGKNVSFCRGIMFLKDEEAKLAMTALLDFLRHHNSPYDTGHRVRKEGEKRD